MEIPSQQRGRRQPHPPLEESNTTGSKAALVNRFIDSVLDDAEGGERKSFQRSSARRAAGGPTAAGYRVFLLSPASCAGERARLLFDPAARFEVARRLRSHKGIPLGEVFSFLSALYFRGKLSYARAFARPPADTPGVFVITAGAGLSLPEQPVRLARLRQFARVPIAADEPRFRAPLERAALRLAEQAGTECEVVLLGSVATSKYLEVLDRALGGRLRFPAEFVGRGDMSRGGLLLRCVEEGRELTYVPLAGALRHGARPPRLVPRPGPPTRSIPAPPARTRR